MAAKNHATVGARRALVACVIGLTVPAAASPVAAQAAADSGTFLVRLGRDTVAVERYVRRGDKSHLGPRPPRPRTGTR